MLGPLLFLIYINDLDPDVQGTISKFAGVTKHESIVNCEEDSVELQKNMVKWVEWADRWQMKFNEDKFW